MSIKKVSPEKWIIASTGKNEHGRTPFVEYRIVGKRISTFKGEECNSLSDIENMKADNIRMEELRRDFRIRNARSEQSATNFYVR